MTKSERESMTEETLEEQKKREFYDDSDQEDWEEDWEDEESCDLFEGECVEPKLRDMCGCIGCFLITEKEKNRVKT